MTAELAIGLAPVAVVLLLAAWLAAAGAVQVRAQLAAGAGARALARGEAPSAVDARAAEAVGPGARTQQVREDDLIRLRVTVPLRVPVLGDVVMLHADAVSPVETTPDDGGAPQP